MFLLQHRPQLSFLFKSVAHIPVEGAANPHGLMAQDFQGARHVQLDVLRQVNLAKSPLPQQAFDLVGIEDNVVGLQFRHGVPLLAVDGLIVQDFLPGVIMEVRQSKGTISPISQ